MVRNNRSHSRQTIIVSHNDNKSIGSRCVHATFELINSEYFFKKIYLKIFENNIYFLKIIYNISIKNKNLKKDIIIKTKQFIGGYSRFFEKIYV